MITEFLFNLEDLPGMTAVERNKLSSLGINTNLDLIKQITNSQQKQQLAQKMQTNLKYVGKWLALADLSRLPSVNSQYCGLILHSGVASVQQLSQIPAFKLHRQILRLQVATLRRKDLCPSIGLVQTWIKEAQLTIRKVRN